MGCSRAKQIGRLLSNKTDSKSKTASSKVAENVTPAPAKQVKNLRTYVYVMFQMQETGLQIVSEAVYGEQAASMQSVKPSQESDVKDLFYMAALRWKAVLYLGQRCNKVPGKEIIV